MSFDYPRSRSENGFSPGGAGSCSRILFVWFITWITLSSLIVFVVLYSIDPPAEPHPPIMARGGRPNSRWDSERLQAFEKEWKLVWMAPFYSYSGYGVEAITFVTGLTDYLPDRIYIKQFGDGLNPNIEKEFSGEVREMLRNMKEVKVERGEFIVSVCHTTPPSWARGCPMPSSVIKIGRTMFETDGVPAHWIRKISMMDQVWVPTKFHIDTFDKAGIPRHKLYAIPEAIDTDFFDPDCYLSKGTGEFQFFEDHFVFLAIFKWEERKGWKTLVSAYLEEFRSHEGTILYIVTHAIKQDQNPLKELSDEKIKYLREIGVDSNLLPVVMLNTEHIPDSQLPLLYKMSKAFVLPSKGEGWGRPIVEAMSMELPVIATNWSGQTEFMTVHNSYPLNYTLESVDASAGPGTSGHQWAGPSKHHLKQLMRHVFENPEEAKMKGKRARLDMVENYSIEIVGEIVRKQLDGAINHFLNTTRAKIGLS